jgi:hypothetical protein
MKLLTVQLLHSPVTLFLLDPNSLLRTMISNAPSLCYSLNVRDQVSHPTKNWQNCGFVYFNPYIPRQQAERQEILNRMAASISRILSALNLSEHAICIC